MGNKIRLLIVEDDELEALDLKTFLEEINFEVVAIENTLEGAIKTYLSESIDLAIIDIYLDGEPDGIKIAEKISEDKIIPFVFLTGASDRHIFEKAKSTLPAHYLLKPYNTLELEYVLELCIEKYNYTLSNLEKVDKQPFLIKQRDAFFKLDFKEIKYIEVEGRYCKTKSDSGQEFLIQQSLSEFMKYLPSGDFIKVHRNYVINNSFVEKVYLSDNLLCLKDDEHIPIGRSFKDNLLQKYQVLKK